MLAIDLTEGWEHALGTTTRVVMIVVLAVVMHVVARRAVHSVVKRMQRAAEGVVMLAAGQTAGAAGSPMVLRSESRARTVGTVLRSVSTTTIVVIAALLVLGELGVSLGPLLAGAGIASVAVGFGTQSLVRDVVAGLFVLVEDQYGVGDEIDAGAASGTVVRVTLRSTQLRDAAGTLWHLPNGAITRVGNQSHEWSRAVLDVVVSADTDLVEARRVISEAAGGLTADPAWAADLTGEVVDLGVQTLDGSGIALRVTVRTAPGRQAAVQRELRQRVKAALDASAIFLAGAPRT